MRKGRCALCGKSVKQGAKVTEEIDGLPYSFDKGECALLFKKFRSVYGSAFFA